ncbi:hypothetical protein HGM15179_012527 [Zosterops borbonicus]|uniref:Uncharacterized protein n=1 Tax=Zosterops borbonicus TaxID=364589 RepID=A0A8K1LI56_9PASS|nr:hypothetical protein HGM15179_012527 [Zosterops borbonicus]
MVKQLCPCSLWGSTGDAEIHPQPVGIHRRCRDPPNAHGGVAHTGAGGCPEEAVIQWETQWREGDPASRLEYPVLGGLHPMERETHNASVLGELSVHGVSSLCSSCGRTAAHEIGAMLEKFMENCLLWRGPHGLIRE